MTLRIDKASCQGRSPQAVVDRAIAAHDQLQKEQDKKTDRKDAVWAVFDLEREAHCRQQAQKARGKAEKKKVKVAVSDPCYEVWTLLHLEETGEGFVDCAQVFDRVKQRWREEFDERLDRKTQIDCSKIIGRRHEAASRAQKRWEAGDPSRTEVYKIIEAIESHVRDSSG